jgi:hypothetical protein
MSGADQLRAALAVKQGRAPAPKRASVPNPIQFARPGAHVACDGKPYTITYDLSLGTN